MSRSTKDLFGYEEVGISIRMGDEVLNLPASTFFRAGIHVYYFERIVLGKRESIGVMLLGAFGALEKLKSYKMTPSIALDTTAEAYVTVPNGTFTIPMSQAVEDYFVGEYKTKDAFINLTLVFFKNS
jgi:hypothetical protein